jgi:DNA-binding response OmpR family regulator
MSDFLCPCCAQPLPFDEALRFEAASGIVVRFGQFAALTRAEAEMLQILIDAKSAVMSKEKLLTSLYWQENDEPNIKMIDVWICKLRKKISPLGLNIQTIWGNGYRLIIAAAPLTYQLKYKKQGGRDGSAG